MEQIITIIGLACFGWLLTVAEPVLMFWDWIGLKQGFFFRLVSCAMCLSFWVGLIATQSIPMAGLVAVLARVIDDYLGNVPLR